MESSEHNWANISETICPKKLVFGKQASWMLLFSEYPDKSHNFTNYTLHLPYLISYYSSAFTINQLHNHYAEVYVPQRLVLIKLIAKGRETLFPGTVFLHINGAYKVSATLASPPTHSLWSSRGTYLRVDELAIHYRHCQTPIIDEYKNN